MMWKFRLSFTCYGISELNATVCGGRGSCRLDGTCLCADSTTWGGEECRDAVCFSLRASNSSSCNGHGKCLGPNICNCTSQWGDLERDPGCSQASCNDVLQNDANVCGGHGRCLNDHACNCAFAYSGTGCGQFNAIALTIRDQWYVWFLILPIGAVLACVGAVFLTVVIGRVLVKQKKRLKKFDKLEDVDLLIAEQAVNRDDSIAHLKINKSLFEVDYTSIKLLKVLGSGGSGSTVYLCEYNGDQYAFKCFKTNDICGTQTIFNEFEREVSILASIAHPNIIKFYGASVHVPRIGYLMEFCEHGDLVQYFCSHIDMIPLDEVIRILTEVASAQRFLHSKKIIHRDLKAENVLVASNLSTRLMDFGLSKLVDFTRQHMTAGVGTSVYMAPELTVGEPYTNKVDVFAFGILAYIVLTKNFSPYNTLDGGNMTNIQLRVASDSNFRPSLDDLSDHPWMQSLVQGCWTHDPNSRYAFQDILTILSTRQKLMKSTRSQEEKATESKEQNVSSDDAKGNGNGEASWKDDKIARLEETVRKYEAEIASLKAEMAAKTKTESGEKKDEAE